MGRRALPSTRPTQYLANSHLMQHSHTTASKRTESSHAVGCALPGGLVRQAPSEQQRAAHEGGGVLEAAGLVGQLGDGDGVYDEPVLQVQLVQLLRGGHARGAGRAAGTFGSNGTSGSRRVAGVATADDVVSSAVRGSAGAAFC